MNWVSIIFGIFPATGFVKFLYKKIIHRFWCIVFGHYIDNQLQTDGGDEKVDTKLRMVYRNSERSVKVRNVNLFAIHFADRIREEEPDLRRFIKRSGLPLGYVNEVSKALRIAEYVILSDSGADLVKSLIKEN